MIIAERISILCAIAEKKRFDFIACLGKAMMRNIKAGDFELWQDLFHLVEKKGLAAADIENFGAVFQTIDVDQRLSDGFPSTFDEFVAAVSVATVSVPVIEFVFLRFDHAMNFVVHHPGEVIAFGGLMQRRHNIEHSSHEVPRCAANPTLPREQRILRLAQVTKKPGKYALFPPCR